MLSISLSIYQSEIKHRAKETNGGRRRQGKVKTSSESNTPARGRKVSVTVRSNTGRKFADEK